MRYQPAGEHEYPIRKDWRYTHSELIRVTRSHLVWNDSHGFGGLSQRVEVGDPVVFLQAYGFEYNGGNWKRGEWNLKVLSPSLGIVWVSNEYTGSVE